MASFCNRHAKIILLAAALLAAGSAIGGAAEVFIDVSRQRTAQITMAVPRFNMKEAKENQKEDSAFADLGQKTMEFDLLFSGYFSMLTDRAVLGEIESKTADARHVPWDIWKEAKVNALVRADYYALPDDQAALEAYLFDVDRHEQLAGIRYTGPRGIFRKMTHKFADEVVYRFSGAAGVADSRIAFTSKVKGHKELFIMDYDGYNQQQITKVNSIIISPDWAPSGGKLLFTSFHMKRPAIYMLDLHSGKITAIGSNTGQSQSAPAWSPDGKTIAFTQALNGNSDIYTINADGTGLRRLTDADSIETSPTWSPDGKKIAFVSDSAGTPQIYIMNADGSGKERFTFNGDYNADPAWSPRGDKIAFTSMLDTRFNIVVKSLDGLVEKQLTADMGRNDSPSWSADGRHLAFTSTRTGTSQIYIMNANGNNQMQLTNMPDGASGCSWGPRN
ncbi:MAG: Tol-Pal system beta propeller repeat protein TolB [Nitrospinae bacterium]|nr:Tol-Pal system beta propeller repeat protein TolB [Nitrospinota bacterium]